MAGTALRTVATWLARRPLVVPALLTGAVLIGLSAGPRADDDAWIGLPETVSLAWLPSAIVIAAAVTGLLAMLVFGRRPTGEQAEPRSLLHQLLGMVMFAAFLMLLFALPRITNTDAETGEDASTPPVEAPPATTESTTGATVEPADGAVAVIVLIVALTVLFWFRRSLNRDRPVGPKDESDHGSTLEPAMARASRHLLDDADPRDAVLLAYRRLEETLERLDLGRADAETPVEHLTRSLQALSIEDPTQARPLLDLAALYARARYSERPITTDDQHRAGAALERAHRRLTGARS